MRQYIIFYFWEQIRDGDGSGTAIGKFCGETLPNGGTIMSTHNEVTLVFSSDYSATGLGFEMMWNTTDPGGT